MVLVVVFMSLNPSLIDGLGLEPHVRKMAVSHREKEFGTGPTKQRHLDKLPVQYD